MNDLTRLQVIDELIEELRGYGHYNAVTHVLNCRKRLAARMVNDAVQDNPGAQTAADTTGQMEEATQRIAV